MVNRLATEPKLGPKTLLKWSVHNFAAYLRIQHGEVERLIVAHKDRLVRFGFDLISHIAEEGGCEIVVVNQPSCSPEQEMVEDMLSIVHTFSCRLYGMRKYKQELNAEYPGYKVQVLSDNHLRRHSPGVATDL